MLQSKAGYIDARPLTASSAKPLATHGRTIHPGSKARAPSRRSGRTAGSVGWISPLFEIDSARRTIRSEETRQTTSSPRLETAAPWPVRRDCAPPRARRERPERTYHPPQMYLRRPEPSRGGQHETKSPCCSSAGVRIATDDDYLAASRKAVLSRISRPASACPRFRCVPPE
jgi:hypothetical protein